MVFVIRGGVTKHAGGRISGWCWSPDKPNERLVVEIIADDRVVSAVSAAQYNELTRVNAMGDGYHGFTLPRSDERLIDGATTIEVRERSSGVIFGRFISRTKYNCAREAQLNRLHSKVEDLEARLSKLDPSSELVATKVLVRELGYALFSLAQMVPYGDRSGEPEKRSRFYRKVIGSSKMTLWPITALALSGLSRQMDFRTIKVPVNDDELSLLNNATLSGDAEWLLFLKQPAPISVINSLKATLRNADLIAGGDLSAIAMRAEFSFTSNYHIKKWIAANVVFAISREALYCLGGFDCESEFTWAEVLFDLLLKASVLGFKVVALPGCDDTSSLFPVPVYGHSDAFLERWRVLWR